MSAAAVPQTPQRPLPGAYLQTPAPGQQQHVPGLSRPAQPVFQPQAYPSQGAAQQQGQLPPGQQATVALPPPPMQTLNPIQRAAKTINDTLTQEMRYPELDSYVAQGISSDYDVPASTAWAPFQKVKQYQIPEAVMAQFDNAQVSTTMGLFAEINHAWVTVDNALYLWDYTHPNPDLIGFEEQPHTITAVKLVLPRAKVFVDAISHLLVVATTSDIMLIGLSCRRGPEGVNGVSLYHTKMSTSVKGINVTCIEGSKKTGRIFFGGKNSDDVYELTYQQEEKWFASRCGKILHTKAPVSSFIVNPFSNKPPKEHIEQMVIDDTRNLLYTLSSLSTICVFHMKSVNMLHKAIQKDFRTIRVQIGHMVSRSEIIMGPDVSLKSISPIPANEAARLALMATTNTGCRIFLSTTSDAYYGSETLVAPSSMQVHHVKFPPANVAAPQAGGQSSSSQIAQYQGGAAINTNSKDLSETRRAYRLPPGYFFCFIEKQKGAPDLLFLSSPDSGRIARPHEPSQMTRYAESGQWLPLDSRTEDIGLTTPPFSAASTPSGFGNELAVQFDKPTTEIAILTNTGIQTIRRRRLVDIFAAALRYGRTEEGLETEVNKFIRIYGRGETSATALAVACGQGSDVTDSRVAKITDQEVISNAKTAFIKFGGKATINENMILDHQASGIENVRPSPRHEGLALYISRLVRSVWKTPILQEKSSPKEGLKVSPTVPLTKLQAIQRDLTHLHEFLSENRTFITGLSGPEPLGRVTTKQEEIALQGEHRAMNSLVTLIGNVIEGISFVLVLFDEQVDEIILSLSDTARQRIRLLTYEGLFCTSEGKDLAKELVKAIVNRNIAKGSNVDTVAEALRRRCGSFCSADDVVIFKAQEQLKKASEAGATSETGRILLNESLKLFEKVAASLSMEHLQAAVSQYVEMAFYGGAIQLTLKVAKEMDRGNRALAWIKDGCPDNDPRKASYESRTKCYDLIHHVIEAVDKAAAKEPDEVDGQLTVTARRKIEAYKVINDSDDEVFQTDLYDWYLEQGWSDRLLEIDSPYVVAYLRRKSEDDAKHADLLWRYYAHYSLFLEAADVQLKLAKSGFDLNLATRIEYLSRAKANASTRLVGMSALNRSRQELVREITDLLDIATIQEDLLYRMRGDPRLQGERRAEVLNELDGQILSLDDLYNSYADQAGYYDLCLLIYQSADYRNNADIESTWVNLVQATHTEALQQGEVQPYELVASEIKKLGRRLHLSESTFPIALVLPLLERYAFTSQRNVGPPTWVVDVFLDLQVPPEAVLAVLEAMFYNDEQPFHGRNRRYIANDVLYIVQRWCEESTRGGGLAFGGEENAIAVADTLRSILSSGVLDESGLETGRVLQIRVEQVIR